MDSSLNAGRRARELAEIRDTVVDVLVVGLGATGAGAALDAASRGLSVAAIDAHDLAFGTSRWSSKLIHGGLRYLAKGQVGVARESAVERDVLLRHTAPHLVRAQPYLLPLTPSVSPGQARLVMTGYRLGDGLRAVAGTPRHLLPGPSRLSAERARTLAPSLHDRGLRGALLSWDGRVVDDARLVVAIARTAAAHGARILTRCRALSLAGDGAQVRDELTGAEFGIRARAVINAAGVWAGQLSPSVLLRPSRGTHLVLRPGSLDGLRTGLHVPIPGESNRFVLVLPQADGRIYVGLTDEPVDGPLPDVPEAPESDVAFLLDILGSVLREPVRRAEVAGAFAGLRPLLAGGTRGAGGAADGESAGGSGNPSGTADLSRRHAVVTSRDGVVTVVGGKLTTYRRMAEDAVDAACPTAPRSRTARLPLVGAGPVVGAGRGPAEAPASQEPPARLVARYGREAWAVQDLARQDPSLAETVATGITRAELVWAVRHEGALDVGDLLDRRTRIGLIPEDRAAALPAAEEALAFDR
ncbi:glycerol-3-phosphate dehydrogenase/oxidase [Microtetraspora sp. NBRC 16547]|uniref:glycerol-3-phosphate dehydrogenase/oxidase n=1 Tax=Microtetraspora sp. NBRC 16547 TaxID=3030993 RepID=UPI0024A47EDC|nr:glycerol-3-phosphate dehydrogenase/oxidase [Microtetraspora sp. NBRC 16547]GLW96695.1 glycerol-3-phosphate dehydrogenase [Microtetraspora sp. NBRC 16547]